MDINKGRASATVLAWAMLAAIYNEVDIALASLSVGEANASIATHAEIVLTVPSGRESGLITMRKHGDADFYEYSRPKKYWEHREGIVLTDIEQKVLWLSAQGNTVEQIGEAVSKSPDAVKNYKKRLFKKLNVTTISEALIYAMNNRML